MNYSTLSLTLGSLLALAAIATAQEAAAPDMAILDAVPNSYKPRGFSLSDTSAKDAAYARAVRDTATFDFSDALKNPNWIVARVLPAGNPKLNRLKLRENEAKVGPFAPTEFLSQVYTGNVSLFMPLTAIPDGRLWPYRLERSGPAAGGRILKSDPFGSEGRENYSPFRQNGAYAASHSCMLLAPTESIQNVQTPTEAKLAQSPEYRPYLLDDDSLGYIHPTIQFYRKTPDLFDPKWASQNRPALHNLLTNRNPFLFAAATRTLAQSGQLAPEFIEQKLLELDKFRQSIFIYSTLLYSPEAAGQAAVKAMQKAIDNARDRKQVEGVLVGIDCARQRRLDIVAAIPTLLGTSYADTKEKPLMPPSLPLYEWLLVPKRLTDNIYLESAPPVPVVSSFVPANPSVLPTGENLLAIAKQPLMNEPLAKQPLLGPEALKHFTLSRGAFVRSVRDMATWDFAFVAQNPHWVVAEIKPPVGPTFTTTRWWAALPTSPDLPAMPPKAAQWSEGVLSWEGTARLVTQLSTLPELVLTPQKSLWKYRYDRTVWNGGEQTLVSGQSLSSFNGQRIWNEGNGGAFTVPDAIGTEGREAYSPFRHGPVDGQTRNLAFCAFPESIQNAEIPNTGSTLKPNPYLAHLIREEWLESVTPAQRFYEDNSALFAPENVTTNRSALLELLDSPNPFLFAAAVRTLSQSGQMGGNYTSAKLLAADRFHQALFVVSTLYYSPEEQARIGVGHIQKAAEKAKNKAQLEGLIIGAFCAYEEINNPRLRFGTPPPDFVRLPAARSIDLYVPLVQTLARKQREFGVKDETDAYLESVISRIGRSEMPARRDFTMK